MSQQQTFIIMHENNIIAKITSNGMCQILMEPFLPYDLYLEETQDNDMDTRIQNLDNFYHWCASRVLTIDRVYAKEILNSIGATQSVTDRDRAGIALSYHCLSLLDLYWVTTADAAEDFASLNLYSNSLSNAFVDVSLRGKQMIVQNRHMVAGDLSTQGYFPKAWVRRDGTFYLLKDGGEDVVEKELLASKICQCFDVRQVIYEEKYYESHKVTASHIITSLEYSMVSREAFGIYALNHEIDALEYIKRLDGYSYYMMNILDYLIGNTDRHWGNWGLLIRNRDRQPVRLYDLMDFNKSFEAYETIDGGICLTDRKVKMSQKEAAVAAVKEVGVNQIGEIDPEWFSDEKTKEMFFARLQVLKEHIV